MVARPNAGERQCLGGLTARIALLVTIGAIRVGNRGRDGYPALWPRTPTGTPNTTTASTTTRVVIDSASPKSPALARRCAFVHCSLPLGPLRASASGSEQRGARRRMMQNRSGRCPQRDRVPPMSLSVFDIFKIGIGPSSSHTMGPMNAARAFVESLAIARLLERTAQVSAQLYGSLALTGRGHCTDRAILLGLEGSSPDTIDPATIESALQRIRGSGRIRLLGRHDIAFDEPLNLLFHIDQTLPGHTNGMRFTAHDAALTGVGPRGVLQHRRRLRGARGRCGHRGRRPRRPRRAAVRIQLRCALARTRAQPRPGAPRADARARTHLVQRYRHTRPPVCASGRSCRTACVADSKRKAYCPACWVFAAAHRNCTVN